MDDVVQACRRPNRLGRRAHIVAHLPSRKPIELRRNQNLQTVPFRQHAEQHPVIVDDGCTGEPALEQLLQCPVDVHLGR